MLTYLIYAKQKHLGYKKGKANQKQQLSDYIRIVSYIAIHATKNFDIKLRSRISYIAITCYSGDAMHLNTL